MRAVPPPVEPTEAGDQMLVAGVAPITDRDRLTVRAATPLRPRKPQKPCDFGLSDGEAGQEKVQRTFSPPNARNQLALF